MVLGLEFDAEYDGATGTQQASSPASGSGSGAGGCLVGPEAANYLAGASAKVFTCRAQQGLTTDFSARIGYTFLDNSLLLYLKGGVSRSRLAVSYKFKDSALNEFYGSAHNDLIGMILGFGLEYKMTKYSVSLEYLDRFYGSGIFGQEAYYAPDNGGIFHEATSPGFQNRSDQLLRLELRYRP